MEALEPLLAKICSSSMFIRSRRLQRFLTYLTQSLIEHPGQPLKEYVIAVSVYDKPASFDPQLDPIVRVEAGRLRARLLEYYSGPGRDDTLIIELPKGSYTPTIRVRATEPRSPDTESVAVIPSDESGDTDLRYLSHGISEGVTNRLAQIPNLRVAPWSMVLRSRAPEQDLAQTAVDLGVRTLVVLRLTVRGETYEVHAEWIDPKQKAHLWGDRYSRKLHDLYDLENEITADLAERIAPHYSRAQMQETRQRYTTDGHAYQLYLKGRHLWNKRTVDAMTKAIQHYQKALDHDSGFALAFAGMADCYVTLATFTFISPSAGMPRAKAAATRAVELDPTLGEARATLACIRSFYEWEWSEAERDFRQALAAAPKYSVGRQWFGASLCAMGRFAAGRKLLRAALDLDPLSPMTGTQLGVAYYLERRYEDAIVEYTAALDLAPEFWAAWHYRGLCHQALNRTAEAIAEAQKAVDLSGDTPVAVAALGHVLAHSGRTADAERLLTKLKSRAACEYIPSYSLAMICCGLARRSEALEYLEASVDERSPAAALWLRGEPRLDPLRSERRFQSLLHRVGLE